MSATEISGKLEGLQLGDLMKMIRVSRRTGKLQLSDHGQQGTIEFLDGRIVRARASWEYDSLGALLVEGGAITEEQLLEAVEVKRANGLPEPIGRVLIDLGMTTDDVVRESMRRQVDRVVGQLMRIDRGNFQFEPGRDSADRITQDIGDVLRELSVTVESSHPGTGRAPVDPRLRGLRNQVLELRRARSRTEIAGSLIQALERHAVRLIVFERRRNGIVATSVKGVDADGLVLARGEASWLADCAPGASYGDRDDARLAPLYERIGAPACRACLLVGLGGLGRPRRTVYADQGSSSHDLPCLDFIDLLVLEAELLAETATARTRKRTRRKSN